MPGFTIYILAGGVMAALLLAMIVFSGPSAAKLQARRLESVRERHSKSSEVAAQAQLKRIFANRQQGAAEGFAQRFGLVHVDFDTQVRTPKRSYDWYAELIAAQTRSAG